jgi:glycosyltransferase involved in cell wall biosynthesis
LLGVHVYPSTFEFETRILKVTKTLVERTGIDRIIIVALARPGLPGRERLDGAREVWRIGCRLAGERFWARTARFIEWSFRVGWALRGEKLEVVNCHSLSVLPLCWVLSRLHRAVLVYEPHELETETATFTGWRQKLAKMVERTFIGRATMIITVSQSIAAHYRADYKRKDDVSVILNVPETDLRVPIQPNPVFRNLFGIPEQHFVFMFQGAFEEVRGAGLLLDAFRQVPTDRHIVFLGFGPMEDEIRRASTERRNIHLHAAVPPAQVIEYTLGADVGFALLDDGCLNHQCALPNKLFHYLHAGLPVIVSDLQEMGALVDHWRLGWRVANNVEDIAACVRELTRDEVAHAAKGARASRATLNWSHEADKLAELYARIAPRGSGAKISAPTQA